MPFGEMTIRLYNVSSISRMPITGNLIYFPILTCTEGRKLFVERLMLSVDFSFEYFQEGHGLSIRLD